MRKLVAPGGPRRTEWPTTARVRLFQSSWLECFTLMPAGVFAALWLPLLAWAAFAAWWQVPDLPALLALAAGGIMTWTLCEYAAHRFIFHFRPRSATGRRLLFLLHENHHQVPGDHLRNMMPATVSLPLAALFGLLFRLALGPAGSALFLGFVLGYVTYDGVHYACHQWPMRGPVLSRLKRHHLRHHHAGASANYAIIAPFWDRVFNTGFPTASRRARTGGR